MWPELLDVVDKRALLATDAQDRADLAFRAARLVETQLTDPDAAIPRYGAVLQVLASHEARARRARGADGAATSTSRRSRRSSSASTAPSAEPRRA